MKRRMLLKSGGMALFAASTSTLPAFLGRVAGAAEPNGKERVLVTIFQRSGMDGLFAVTPYDDARLAALRPNLMLPRPGSGEPHARIDLDGRFGLHPSFEPLLPHFRDGSLAFVHGAGSPDNTRSHSVAQLWWESGTPGNHRTADGWLSRAVDAAGIGEDTPLNVVSMTEARPRILYGDRAAACIEDVELLNVAFKGDSATAALRNLYSRSDNVLLRQAGQNSLDFARILDEAKSGASAVHYPERSSFAHGLREIAHLIKADVGLRVAFAESATGGTPGPVRGTWDSHSNEAAMDGPFPTIAGDFSQSLAAFWEDLGAHRDRVVVVTMTDFGRNVVENEGIGTDHGRATAMIVLGENIDGGKVHGTLPERFERDALEDGMDLPVTTDFRSVISSLTAAQLGVRSDSSVFPGFNGARMPILSA